MNPRFARVRPDMTVDEAIRYMRRQARRTLETIYYVYVLDREQSCSAWSRSATCSSAPGNAACAT